MFFKAFICFCVAVVSFPALSQVQFEKGYLIKNDGQKVAVSIRNAGWDNNPISFRYKTADGQTLEAGLEDVKEFEIENSVKFVRATVKVDESPTNLNILSNDRNPIWSERTVFLKELVAGPARLYFYKNEQIKQYLYQKADSAIVTLVFKRYINNTGEVSTNFGYRQQLWNDVNCQGVSRESMSRVDYRDTDLVKYFQQYNTCTDPTAEVKSKGAARETFNVKITPGADLTMLQTKGFTKVNPDGGKANTASFRVGAELEFIPAFNQGKWAILVEPAFQYYQFSFTSVSIDLDVNYWSLDLPVGIRHSFFLPAGGKIFVNGLYVQMLKNKQIKDDREMEVSMGNNAAFGAGIAKGRLSAEVRYYFSRFLRSSFIKIDPKVSKVSLIVGYKLFRK